MDLVVMPELCISGYTCGELFHQEQLLLGSEKALLKVAEATAGLHAAGVVGVPLRFEEHSTTAGWYSPEAQSV